MGCPGPSRFLVVRAGPRLPPRTAPCPESPKVSGLPCAGPRTAGGPGDCRTSAGPGAPPGRAGGNAPRRPPPPRLPPAAAALPRRGAALKGGSPPPGALAARAPREPAAAMPPRAPPEPGSRPPPRATDVARGAGHAGRHGLPPLALRPWRWLLLLALPAACSAPPPPRPVYTNHWAVQVLGGPGAADRVAAAHGYLNLGQVSTAGPARPKLSRPPAATREGRLASSAASGAAWEGGPHRWRRRGCPAGIRGECRGTLGGEDVVACVDRPAGGPKAVGPQAVSPGTRTRKCGLGSPDRAPTPAQPLWSGRPRGRCVLPTRAILSVHSIPGGLPSPSSASQATLPSTGGAGLWARCARQGRRRWLGDLSVAGNSGTGFPLAWRAGACAQMSGLGQGESSTQKLPDGWKLDSALKTSLGREDGCFALSSSCS